MSAEIDTLFSGLCTLVFQYPDGSQVKCTSSLNASILEQRGLTAIDGIVDFETHKIIPTDMFIYLAEVSTDSSIKLSELDEFLSAGVKSLW